MESQFIHSPDTGAGHCHCVSLWVQKNKRLLLTWYVYPESEHVGASIAFATKEPQHASVGNGRIILRSSGSSYGNPLVFEADGIIRLYFVIIQGRYWDDAVAYQATSEDEGRTFSSPHPLFREAGLMIRHAPVFGPDGLWHLGVYHETEKYSAIYSSQDQAQSWQESHRFPRNGIIQPDLVVFQGKLYAFFRPTSDPYLIWYAIKDGMRWSPVQSLDVPCPLSGIAAFASKSDIFLVHNHTRKQQRFPLSLTKVNWDDSGPKISYPWNFEQVQLETSYPSFANHQGDIFGAYTYNRRMIKFVNIKASELENQLQEGERSHAGQEAYKSISYYKNLHQDKRLFILASGPSLKDLDLEPLKRRMTMGLNRSGLIFPDTTYHCVMDQRLFDEYEDVLAKARTLFTLEGRPFGVRLRLIGTEGFSSDLEEGVYSGYTISYLALQVAVYMGFKEIVYLGLDLCHSSNDTHFFGHDFRSKNHEHIEFPKMIRMLSQAAEIVRSKGVKVYNCSPRSKLDAFTKISFEQALKL